MTEHYKQLPENYDDTIYEAFDHHDDSGWSEKKVEDDSNCGNIHFVPAKKWDEKKPWWENEGYGATEVRPAPRRLKRKPSVLRKLWNVLRLNLFDVFALVFLVANLVAFGRAYFDGNLLQVVFFGVASILFALAFLQRK